MIASILLMAATTVPIHVGRFDPAEFPEAERIERRLPHADLNHRVEQMLTSSDCKLEGQTKLRYDIVVPYAVLLESSGEAKKVVVKDIGCARIERLVGEIAAELAKAKDFKLKHQAGDRWYVSEAYFTRTNEEAAMRMDDDDKVVCKADKMAIGTRTKRNKVCRTVAEWKLYDTDREQFRRDFRGADPLSASD